MLPINEQGEISDDTRICSSLDTLRYAIEAGARVIVMSHLGRPVEGHWDSKFSLSVVADRLGTLLGRKIPLVRDWTSEQGKAQLNALQDAEIVLLENVRFNHSSGKRVFRTAHQAWQRDEGDEFIQPTVIGNPQEYRIVEQEPVFFFNFRSDRR